MNNEIKAQVLGIIQSKTPEGGAFALDIVSPTISSFQFNQAIRHPKKTRVFTPQCVVDISERIMSTDLEAFLV